DVLTDDGGGRSRKRQKRHAIAFSSAARPSAREVRARKPSIAAARAGSPTEWYKSPGRAGAYSTAGVVAVCVASSRMSRSTEVATPVHILRTCAPARHA